jgi:hypothetical protein
VRDPKSPALSRGVFSFNLRYRTLFVVYFYLKTKILLQIVFRSRSKSSQSLTAWFANHTPRYLACWLDKAPAFSSCQKTNHCLPVRALKPIKPKTLEVQGEQNIFEGNVHSSTMTEKIF